MQEEQKETPVATTRDVLILSGFATLISLMLLFGSFGVAAVRSHVAAEASCSQQLHRHA